jgi:hypothetical protein
MAFLKNMVRPLVPQSVRPYLGKLVRRMPLRWHIPNCLNQIEVIQYVINYLGGQRYVEIGVAYGMCFCALTVPEKIGVDPISPSPAVILETSKLGVRYFAMPSDDFFKQCAPLVLAGGVDVVFIDGLHTAAQAYRDCINSLKYLNRGGLILLHDCFPSSELQARVAESIEDAANLNGSWTGDVWKAILRLRTQHPDLQTCVIHCDYGIGLVYRAQNNSKLSLTVAQIDSMTYADLARDPRRLLGLHKPIHLMEVLKKLKSERC